MKRTKKRKTAHVRADAHADLKAWSASAGIAIEDALLAAIGKLIGKDYDKGK